MSNQSTIHDKLLNLSQHSRHKKQARIIAAAEDEFVCHGFKGASIMRIAKRCNLPRANIHYYFKSKLELYTTILNNIIQLWNNTFDKIHPDDDPAEALAIYIRAKVHYSMTNPKASRIFASEIIHGAPHLSDYLNTDFKGWINNKARVIQTWVDQGKMDAIDPMHLLFTIWGATQQYANFSSEVEAALNHPLEANDFERATQTITHVILKGCGLSPPIIRSTP